MSLQNIYVVNTPFYEIQPSLTTQSEPPFHRVHTHSSCWEGFFGSVD